MTLRTVSPPRLSTEDKGKGTVWRQDLETEITQAIEQGGEEAEIACLVSLWSDQMASDTVNDTPCYVSFMFRLFVSVWFSISVNSSLR